MLNNLIQMAKNGMFDIAFLLASKHNLYNELFNSLRKDYDITFEELKELLSLKEKKNIIYLDLCYGLTKLYCEFRGVIELDISKNIKLTKLNCSFNLIKELNTSNNVNLEQLDCHFNKINELDMSMNVNLTELYCSDNNISNLDLSNNLNLVYLDCSNNPNLKHVILNKQVEGKIEIYKDDHTEIIYVK